MAGARLVGSMSAHDLYSRSVRPTVELLSVAAGRCPFTCGDGCDGAPNLRKSDSPAQVPLLPVNGHFPCWLSCGFVFADGPPRQPTLNEDEGALAGDVMPVCGRVSRAGYDDAERTRRWPVWL